MSEPAAPALRDPVAGEEERDRVARALAELPREDREILVLRYVEGVSPSELRRRLDLSRSTVWRRIDDARRKFLDIFRSREE